MFLPYSQSVIPLIQSYLSLAYLEIYTVLAIFFSRFDLQLEQPTTGKDLAWSDRFAKAIKEVVKVKVLKDHWQSFG